MWTNVLHGVSQKSKSLFFKYEGYSINRVNLVKGMTMGNSFEVCTFFFGNQLWYFFFWPRRLSAWSYFTGCCTRSVSLPESQCVSIPCTLFSAQARRSKSLFSQFAKNVLTKTSFYIHIRYSSVNFTWFTLFSAIENLMTEHCSSLENCLICCHMEEPPLIFLWD